ncbi:MAG: hypothetical protein PHX44_09595 [Sulfurimonas sp.]|uniref:hypothetical protein n=1 Tax=Sulfurimonas sp. TaxID=2022749 RepID=UPI002606048E|nr:hypothetical protein [Sulfurimonas sp.]MDD2653288.1 hypothetical protein [Sulfurimonas sp.]MDD3451245.1 hypothetical protein [Sulfurimonas sp.]
MFDIDLLIAFALMGALFLRQISIYKEPNKINYAPLMIGIGAISATLHFITHPEATQTLLVLKESLFPVLVSLILFFIINILHQTQISDDAKMEKEFTKALIEELRELKAFSAELEKKMILSQQEDRESQEQQREKFRHDIKSLDAILENQNRFLEEFQKLQIWHEDVSRSFENFTEVQLPSLDNVVHKHIDIFRVAEQDHFNKVKATLERTLHTKEGIAKEIGELKNDIQEIGIMAQTIAKTITKQTLEQLVDVLRPFEKELLALKSHTEGVGTSLYESENKLSGIREQSEMIMKQMLLSSKKMSELQAQNSSLHDVFAMMRELVKEVESIRFDYIKAQSQLSIIVSELQNAQADQVQKNKEQMDAFLATLKSDIDASLEKMSMHGGEADAISSNLKFLSKQAQLKNRYTELES